MFFNGGGGGGSERGDGMGRANFAGDFAKKIRTAEREHSTTQTNRGRRIRNPTELIRNKCAAIRNAGPSGSFLSTFSDADAPSLAAHDRRISFHLQG